MSRPFRFLFPAILLLGALGFAGCVGTIYGPMYSNRKNHFKAPEEKTSKEASAESILGAVDSRGAGGAGAADAGGLPPAAGGADIPGLPPAGLPDAGAAPAAPAAPAPAAPPQ